MGLFDKIFGKNDVPPDLGRNDPCWCGSGKKYKNCHLESDDAKRARLRGKTCKTAT